MSVLIPSAIILDVVQELSFCLGDRNIASPDGSAAGRVAEAFDSEAPHGEAWPSPLAGVSLRHRVGGRRLREVPVPLNQVVRLQVEAEQVKGGFLAHDGGDDHVKLER